MKRRILVFFGLALLSGCAFASVSHDDQIVTPTLPPCTVSTDLSAPSNQEEMRIKKNGNRVGAVSLQSESLFVLFIPEPPSNPQVVEFNLRDGSEDDARTLPSQNVKLARFDIRTNTLVTASPTVSCPPLIQSQTCWQIENWNLKADKLEATAHRFTGPLHDLAVSTDGGWALEAGNILELVNLDEPSERKGYVFAGLREQEAVSAVFDLQDKFIAYGLKVFDNQNGITSGEVQVEGWNGTLETSAPFSAKIDLGLIKLGRASWFDLDQIPIALALDSSRGWLAVQTMNSFELRNLSALYDISKGPVVMPKSENGVIRFNPIQPSIAIAHSEGLSVLSLPHLDSLFTKKGPAVTSLSYSNDGCLLAWGDVEGTVHIINAPKP